MSFIFYLAPDNNAVVNVDGCDSNTVIWNVTDPANPLKIAYTLNGSKATFAIPCRIWGVRGFQSDESDTSGHGCRKSEQPESTCPPGSRTPYNHPPPNIVPPPTR